MRGDPRRGDHMTPGPVTDVPMILAAPEGVTSHSAPNGLNLDDMASSLRKSHVFTQTPDQIPELEKVVAQARGQGHDISLVVLTDRQPVFTKYRDIATELQHQVGGTVLVFGPNAAGSSSTEFSRATLEDATIDLNFSQPTVAARQMVDSITEPGIDWTAVTLVLIVVVIVGAVVARLRSVRARTRRPADTPTSVGAASGVAGGDATTPDTTTPGADRPAAQ